jgi:hypothetical protein
VSGHPGSLGLAAGDESSQVSVGAAAERAAKFLFLQKHGVGGAGEESSVCQSAPDLDGGVAEERAGLVVDPEDVVLAVAIDAPS